MYVHVYIQESTRQVFLNCCISTLFLFCPDQSVTFLHGCWMVKGLIDAVNLFVVLTHTPRLRRASGCCLCICGTLRCESLVQAAVFFFSAGH